uniref:40-residue YVTN family beta-propeller repeat protein n=1 Tax=Solibacter usitatus (strain Ellin6076) TaxID=234267 RepID=Q02B96_SOLUE
MPGFAAGFRTAIAWIALCPAMPLPADERPYLAVIEKAAGAVGFFAEDGRLLREVKIGSFPHEAVLSGDGRLYVSDNGVLWMTEDKMGTNTISVVDVRSIKKIDQIDLGKFHRPHGIAIVPGSNRLLVTTERPAGLILVDPAERRVVRDYDVKGKSPHMVIPMPGGKLAFVSNTDSDAVAAIDLTTGAVKLIPTGARPQGAVLSSTGDRLYVVNTSGNQISIIDTRRQEVVGNIPTGKGPGRIVITPDGKTLVYNLQFEPGVGFADISTGKQTAMVALSGRPLSLTMNRDGARVFAGIQDQDKVCVISTRERRIERVIETPKGSGPDPAMSLEGR